MKYMDMNRGLHPDIITKMNPLWEKIKTSLENRDYKLARMQIIVMEMDMMKIVDEMERKSRKEDTKPQQKKQKNKERND